MKISLSLLLSLCLFTISLAGCGGGGPEVIVADEETLAEEAAAMEAYNEEYEKSMENPNQN